MPPWAYDPAIPKQPCNYYFCNFGKKQIMTVSDLKLKIFRQIDSLEKNRLEELYGVLSNFINGHNDLIDWGNLTKEQQKGISDAVDEIDSGKGITHEKVMEDIRKEYKLPLKKQTMKNIEITAVFEPCDEGGFIAYVQEIPGINTQGETIDEAKENLADAVNLVFEDMRATISKGKANKMITQTMSFRF